MSPSQHDFTAALYGARAQDYVTSAVHRTGADLDAIEDAVRGCAEARVLDLGCGGGHVSYRAAPHVAEVVACDVSAGMLEAVAATAAERGFANIAVRQAPAEGLPFADASFDIVLCRFSAHHWQDMAAGLREARRVVKPAGFGIMVDVIAPADAAFDTHLQAVELLRDPSHGRNASLAEWVAALAGAGWRVDGLTRRTLRMDFAVWTARTRTPELHAAAIRSIQQGAPAAVQRHFAIGADGSFDIEAVSFALAPA